MSIKIFCTFLGYWVWLRYNKYMKKVEYILIILIIGLVVFWVFKSRNPKVNPEETNNVLVETISEQKSVENYLRKNISILSPVQAVLGGTWYVVSLTTDIDINSGNVVYEDGHIRQSRIFTYTTNEKGEVLGLIIK